MRKIVFGSALGLSLIVGCAAPPSVVEEKGESSSHIEGADADAAPSADTCSAQASQARAKATFERTTSCAIDAATAGFGEKIELAGRIFGDVKQVTAIIKRVAGALQVTNLSSARAYMCVRAVGGYAIDESTKTALTAASVGLTDAEVNTLWDQISSMFTVGTSDTFAAFNAAADDPSAEKLISALTKMVQNVANVANFVNTCGSVLAEFGTVSLPSIAKYSTALANIGTVASIVNCSMTLINNSIDVGTELYCLGQDYKRIREQQVALQNANDDRCAAFADYVTNPALRPMLDQGGNTSEERTSACYQVMHHWGSCVYNAHRDGILGSTALSCDECQRICTAYVNGAGPNAYLQPVIDGAMDRTGANDPVAVRGLVMAAGTCMAQVAPNDGIKPCVNFCRGQVADCN
jgi:hypothetical protein